MVDSFKLWMHILSNSHLVKKENCACVHTHSCKNDLAYIMMYAHFIREKEIERDYSDLVQVFNFSLECVILYMYF